MARNKNEAVIGIVAKWRHSFNCVLENRLLRLSNLRIWVGSLWGCRGTSRCFWDCTKETKHFNAPAVKRKSSKNGPEKKRLQETSLQLIGFFTSLVVFAFSLFITYHSRYRILLDSIDLFVSESICLMETNWRSKGKMLAIHFSSFSLYFCVCLLISGTDFTHLQVI